MKMHRAVAAIASVLMLCAGCGGSGDKQASGDSTRTTAPTETTTTSAPPTDEGLCGVAGRLDQKSAVSLFERPPQEIKAFFDSSDDLFAAGLDVVPADSVADLKTVRKKYADFAAQLAKYDYDFQAVIGAVQTDPELAAAANDVDDLAADAGADRLRTLVATKCGITIDPLQLATG